MATGIRNGPRTRIAPKGGAEGGEKNAMREGEEVKKGLWGSPPN